MHHNINPSSGLGFEGNANLLTLDGVNKLDDIRTISEILQYLEFATDPPSSAVSLE
jgi:hypothetical protein